MRPSPIPQLNTPVQDSAGNASSVSLRSVGIVTLLSVGQLILLLVMQLVLADIFGASAALDAYLSAYALPLVVGGILSVALGSVVIPLYNEQLAAHGQLSAETQLGRLGVLLLLVSISLAALMSWGAALLVDLFYAEFEPTVAQATAAVLRILAWLVPVNTLTGFLFAIYHARRHFFLPAAAGLCGPALTIGLFVFVLAHTIESLAWAVLAGGLLGCALLLPGFPRGERLTSLPPRQVSQRFLMLLMPLLLGAAYSHLVVLVDRSLADRLSAGSISHMAYAWRITTAASTLITSGLSVVIFPSLARHAAAKDLPRLRSDLAEGWRLLAVALIPALVGIVFCGEAVVRALFERGAFTSRDADAVARLLRLYTGFVVAAAVGELAGRTYFALGRMWLPTLVGMFGFAIGAVAKLLVVDRFAAEGLVAVTSLHYLLNAALLLGLLRWVGGNRCSTGVGLTIVRSVSAAAVAVGPAFVLMRNGELLHVVGGLLVATCIYPLSLWTLGDEFARRTADAMVTRLPKSNR